MRRKRALGRGLSALIPPSVEEGEAEADGSCLRELPLSAIRANPLQPRRRFDQERLQELAESIRIHGVIQPVVVTRSAEGYRLVVGERRCRAARMAGLETIPALIREMVPQQTLEAALIENLRREDLNPVEEAQAYHYLIREHGLTHDQLAERLGCSRPAISNALRLLALPDEIRSDLESGVLTAGHARAVMGLEGEARQLRAWREIRGKGLSVRQSEALVAGLLAREGGNSASGRGVVSPELGEIQDHLSQQLGVAVQIRPRSRGRGRIELHYRDTEELERLVELLIYLGERVSSRALSPSLP